MMTSSFGWTEWLSMMGSFLIVLVLLVVTLIAIKKVGPKIGIHGSKRLQLLEIQNLGGRQKLVLVRVNNEQVLIGLSGQSITKLAQFPHPEMSPFDDHEGTNISDVIDSEVSSKGGFEKILSRVLKR